MSRGKVVIVAPYWGHPGHLGWTRVERFARWLAGAGYEVVVVGAGSHDRRDTMKSGELIRVRDPIGFYRDPTVGSRVAAPPRRTNLVRRNVAYLLLVPDPVVAWARRAAAHSLVLQAGRGAEVVLASSPPESVHVAAARLARRLDARLVMDLRDGWLDEPMIHLLKSVSLQRWRHRRLEARLLRRADRVLVTSERWQRMLAERVSEVADRIEVVTNCYPQEAANPTTAAGRHRGDGPLTLLYAGKFFSSRAERRVEELFRPLLEGIVHASGGTGQVLVVGNLVAEEREALEGWDRRLHEHGWRVEARAPVDRDTALELMRSADGLLLLSSSMASLPAKLFDYLPSGRPILAVAPEGSAVWQLGHGLDRVHLVTPTDAGAVDEVRRFLMACASPLPRIDLPGEYDERHVRDVFFRAVGITG